MEPVPDPQNTHKNSRPPRRRVNANPVFRKRESHEAYNERVNKYGHIRELERKIRASVVYAEWVVRNKAAACLFCGGMDKLECHHVVDLYHVVLGLWKLYGGENDVLSHARAMHQNDQCDSVTLCNACHAKRHPGRSMQAYDPSVRTDNWTAVTRHIGFPFRHSTAVRTSTSLGLVGLQTLLALGWYVLNGHLESRMVEINRRNLARMLGKSPGTSFNGSLKDAMETLQRLGVVLGSHRDGNRLEVHLSQDYLEQLGENPWFIPLDDVATSSMCVLTLKWFLGTQSNRRTYRIGLDKLKTHLGMTIRNNAMAARAIRKACTRIRWAKVDVKRGMCVFALRRRGATPVFSLRKTLKDSLEQGR